MRRTFSFAALLAGLVGCGSKPDAGPNYDTAKETSAAPSAKVAGGVVKTVGEKLPDTLDARYQGRTAEDWGRDLLDADERTSMFAGQAIERLKSEGLRFSLKAMKSDIPHVRHHGLAYLDTESAKKYPGTFLPMFTALLDDPIPIVRSSAVLSISRCDFVDGLPALRAALAKEKPGGIRSTYDLAIGKLEKTKKP